MRVLFCCATFQELKVVKEKIKSLKIKQHLPFDFFCCGVGIYGSIFSLTKYLLEHTQDQYFIVNIGVCWYFGKCYPCIQGGVIKTLQNQKEQIIPQSFVFAPLKSIISCETPLEDTVALAHFWNELFIDMESIWIEYVAQQFHYPRIFLKIPYDKIGDGTKNFDYKKALENLNHNLDYQKLVEKILFFLSSF